MDIGREFPLIVVEPIEETPAVPEPSPTPVPQEEPVPVGEYDETPSDEYLRGAVALLRGLMAEGKVR